MLGHENLMNWFLTNGFLINDHKYSLQDIENMLPFERLIYVDMVIEKEKQAAEMRKNAKI